MTAAQPLPDEQLAAIRAEITAALSTAGAYCGDCGFEPGETGCPDCIRVRELYADALMPIINRLRTELARAGGLLAGVWPCTCGHLQRQHDHDAVLGRDFCRGCPGDTDLHDYTPAPSEES